MDVLEQLYRSPAGKFVASKVGLTDPPKLRRGRVLPTGAVLLGALGEADLGRRTLEVLGIGHADPIVDVAEGRVEDEKGR